MARTRKSTAIHTGAHGAKLSTSLSVDPHNWLEILMLICYRGCENKRIRTEDFEESGKWKNKI